MTLMTFVNARPVPQPEAWSVSCPDCNRQIECEMTQDPAGVYYASDQDGDPCVRCEECSIFFIPSNASIRVSK